MTPESKAANAGDVRHQHLPASMRRDADHALVHRDFGSDAAA
jgi:hypothetical protein